MAKKQTKTQKNKYPETVKITFDPQFSAATRKTLLLREEETELVGNKVRKSYKPLIEGLPTVFTVEKGEVVEITTEQFLQLYKMGFIDGPQDLAKKQAEFNSVGTQSGVDPAEHRSAESLAHLYEDKLIRIA
jgi:hypothetical protein